MNSHANKQTSTQIYTASNAYTTRQSDSSREGCRAAPAGRGGGSLANVCYEGEAWDPTHWLPKKQNRSPKCVDREVGGQKKPHTQSLQNLQN